MKDGSSSRQPSRSPMLRACHWWEKTSARGEVYLAGRMGGLKVLIFRSREDGENAPTHVLMVTEAPPKNHQGEKRQDNGQSRDPELEWPPEEST
jgi:hypothetical protein